MTTTIVFIMKSQGFILHQCFFMLVGELIGWSKVQKNMLKNIFNFIITLATKKNPCKWCLSATSTWFFCSQPATPQHIVSSCKCYLDDGMYT